MPGGVGPAGGAGSAKVKDRNEKRTVLGVLLLAAAVLLLIAGVFRGEADQVLGKAAALCLDCCGIG